MNLCTEVKSIADKKFAMIKDTIDTVMSKVKALAKNLELKMSGINFNNE